MSYEKKMKDLMARLVSMAPEPPPYPEEESPMARHETKKERRPILVFAGAAALVTLVALPLLLFTGGGDPFAGTSSTTSTTLPVTTSTQTPVTTTTSEPTTTTTADPRASLWAGTLYLTQTPENSNLGNPALVPVPVAVTGVSANEEFTAALGAMGSALPELSDHLSNAVPPDVRIVGQTSMETDSGFVLTLDMNEAFLQGAGGLLADVTMLNQLVYTATEPFMEDASVLFTVNGEPVEAFGSEGIVLTDPVSRETFIDSLAPIFLTGPIMQTESVWVVSGRANTFEAALTARVLDGSGDVIHEEPVQATCGSGCWGEFEVEMDADLIVPGESTVQLLTYSAEDGSPTNVITVPIPSGGVWSTNVGS